MDPHLLQRRYEREKAARRQAEALLEAKSFELYQANGELKRLADELAAGLSARAPAAERLRSTGARVSAKYA